MSLPGNYNLIGDSHIASATCGQFFNTCELLTNGSTRTPRTTDSLPAAASGVAADREHLHYSAYESIAIAQPRNPWAPQWDMSLVKKFMMWERLSAGFRFEAAAAGLQTQF